MAKSDSLRLGTTLMAALAACTLCACDDNGASQTASSTAGVSGAVRPAAEDVVLAWTPPLQNTDGSMLANLAGYHIYYGTSASSLDHVVDVHSNTQVACTIPMLTAGTWFFTIRAYNAVGEESADSQIVSESIGTA